MCSALRSPLIASVGQRFTHAVQPMHVSMIRYAIAAFLARRRTPRQEICGDRLVLVDSRAHIRGYYVADDAGLAAVLRDARALSSP